ncbi:MAG: SPFH domain-containing protein, partial [Anaerovorax sp.]
MSEKNKAQGEEGKSAEMPKGKPITVEESMIEQKEKLIRPVSGLLFLIMGLLLYVVAIAVLVYASTLMWDSQVQVWTMAVILSLVYMILIGPMIFIGLKIVNPNEAVVLVLFGKYYGTISKDGFFWVNPFCRAFNPTAKITYSGKERIATANKKVSLKAMTLNNEKQKVNDLEGNPIEIGVIVIWKIVNSAKAVFNVDDYVLYISTQCDSAIRHVARKYPYDASEDGQEKSLRG